jgi:hypothetical protein
MDLISRLRRGQSGERIRTVSGNRVGVSETDVMIMSTECGNNRGRDVCPLANLFDAIKCQRCRTRNQEVGNLHPKWRLLVDHPLIPEVCKILGGGSEGVGVEALTSWFVEVLVVNMNIARRKKPPRLITYIEPMYESFLHARPPT